MTYDLGADVAYVNLTNRAMCDFVQAMLDIGMTTYVADADGSPGMEDGYAAFSDAVPMGTVGIACHKLQSNGPWIVTARECKEALAVFASLAQSERERCMEPLKSKSGAWEDFLCVLREGAADNGFVVM